MEQLITEKLKSKNKSIDKKIELERFFCQVLAIASLRSFM